MRRYLWLVAAVGLVLQIGAVCGQPAMVRSPSRGNYTFHESLGNLELVTRNTTVVDRLTQYGLQQTAGEFMDGQAFVGAHCAYDPKALSWWCEYAGVTGPKGTFECWPAKENHARPSPWTCLCLRDPYCAYHYNHDVASASIACHAHKKNTENVVCVLTVQTLPYKSINVKKLAFYMCLATACLGAFCAAFYLCLRCAWSLARRARIKDDPVKKEK